MRQKSDDISSYTGRVTGDVQCEVRTRIVRRRLVQRYVHPGTQPTTRLSPTALSIASPFVLVAFASFSLSALVGRQQIGGRFCRGEVGRPAGGTAEVRER